MPVIRHRLLSTLFVWSLFSIVACGAGLTPDEYLTNAKDYIEKDEFQAAAIELSNALQKEPGMLEARWLLATVAIELGDGAKAEKEVTRAMDLGLAQQSVQPLLVKAINLQSDWDRVLAETSQLVEGMPKEDQALILGLRGQAYLGKGQFDDAKKTLDRALEIDPVSPAALVGMAAFNGLQREYGEAQRWAQLAVGADASSVEAWSALGDIELMEGNFEKAEAAFTNAIKFRHYPSLDSAKRALVRIHLEKLTEAEADIQTLKRAQLKAHPYVLYVEGVSYFKQKKYPEAAQAFEESYSRTKSLQTGIYLATTHLLIGNLEQARSYIERIAIKAPRSPTVRRVQGEILIRHSETDAAKDVVRTLLQDAPDDPLTYRMLIRISLLQGETAQGVKYAKKLMSLEPESQDAKDLLHLAKLFDGQTLDKAVENPVSPESFDREFLYALEAFKNKNFDQAMQRAQRLHERYPDKVQPLNLMAGIYLSIAKWDLAKIEFEKVLKLQPNEPTAARNLAKVEATEGQLESARRRLRALLEEYPQDMEANLLLAEIENRIGNQMDGIRVLEEALKHNPDDMLLRTRLAGDYFRAGHIVQVLEVTRDLNNKQLKEQPALLALRVKAQLRAGDVRSAIRSSELWVDAVPDSAEAWFFLAESLVKNGNDDRVLKALKKSIQLDSDYLPARVGEIRMLAKQGDREQATEAMTELKRGFGDQPEIIAIEGWLSMVNGEFPSAVERFATAAKQQPGTELTLYWAQALWLDNKQEQAMAVLQDWLKEHPQDLTVWMYLGGTYLSLERKAEAKAAYASVIDLYPNHVMALNNMASLLGEEDRQQAIAYAERAYQLQPNNPLVLDTLGMLLIEGVDAPRGRNLIHQAAEGAPNNLGIQLHMAHALVQAGRFDEAHDAINAIIDKGPDTPFAKEARRLLASIPDSRKQ